MEENTLITNEPEQPQEQEATEKISTIEQPDETAQLANEYPDAAKDGEQNLPQEVMELREKGMSLLSAYRLYDLRQTKTKLAQAEAKFEAEVANRAAEAAATGSLAGGEAHVKDYYTSEEWDKLPHSIKERFIKSGRIFEFMKKWSGK